MPPLPYPYEKHDDYLFHFVRDGVDNQIMVDSWQTELDFHNSFYKSILIDVKTFNHIGLNPGDFVTLYNNEFLIELCQIESINSKIHYGNYISHIIKVRFDSEYLIGDKYELHIKTMERSNKIKNILKHDK
jgi:hypothetical protein